MKFIFIVITFFGFLISVSAQSLKVEKEFNSSYFELNGLEIKLTYDDIVITKDNQNIYLENLSGKKIFKSSPAENYSFIGNFHFPTEKIDYPVEVRVFDRKGEMIFPYKFVAPYDLPHPLLSLNDNGILASFDPLNFKVKLISEETYDEIALEKDVPFEMEKAAFMEITEDFLFVLTSHQALDITETANNVSLYRINLSDKSIDKKIIEYNTPTLLKIIGGYVFVSGVKFEDLKPIGKTIKLDLNLKELSANDRIIEKIIPYGKKYYAKYFNTMCDLSSDLSVSNEKQLSEGGRILDIAIINEKLIALTNKAEDNTLYLFLPDLNVDFKSRLNIFGVNRIENFSAQNKYLIIHHDSKSIKLTITEN